MQKVDQATKNEVKQSKIDQFFSAEDGQEWTVSTTTATVQYIIAIIQQVFFLQNCTVLTTRMK